MKKVIQILALTLMISCGRDIDKISNPSDLKSFAGLLEIELQLAQIKPICNENGLQEVEKFLENKSESEQQRYVLKVGAYLGECIIKSYGGSWVEHKPEIWAVKLPDGNLVFPIGKVQKFVDNPISDSFSSMYGIIPIIFELNN